MKLGLMPGCRHRAISSLETGSRGRGRVLEREGIPLVEERLARLQVFKRRTDKYPKRTHSKGHTVQSALKSPVKAV